MNVQMDLSKTKTATTKNKKTKVKNNKNNEKQTNKKQATTTTNKPVNLPAEFSFKTRSASFTYPSEEICAFNHSSLGMKEL